MNCSEIRPQLEAYALDALDVLTRARVENHLVTCTHCRATVTELRNVLGELPFAVSTASPLRPPPTLKRQLLQAIDAQVHAHAQATAVKQTFAPHAERAAPIARRGSWLSNPRVWMVSLATSMLVIVALVAWNLTSNLKMQQALSSARVAQQKVDEIKDQQALAVPVLNSLSALEIVLTSPDPSSNASGKVVIDPSKPTVVFIGYNLPRLPAGQTYVLWTIDKGVMRTFLRLAVPAPDGHPSGTLRFEPPKVCLRNVCCKKFCRTRFFMRFNFTFGTRWFVASDTTRMLTTWLDSCSRRISELNSDDPAAHASNSRANAASQGSVLLRAQ
ncbi:MAG: anti-sigma factor [Chloroflexi bacterium]|nr:anti-sigma factor [Chloroflexota bacterium]